jgi:hypothetical protein
MEDVVGIKAKDQTGRAVAFMVWGRLFDPVDDRELLAVVKNRSSECAGAPMADFGLCNSLAEVANHEYFFEGLLWFARRPIVFGEDYQAWRTDSRRRLIEDGEGLYFLGRA